MIPDTGTTIGTGIVIIVANVGLFAWLHGDLVELAKRVDSLSERMARIEGQIAISEFSLGLPGTSISAQWDARYFLCRTATIDAYATKRETSPSTVSLFQTTRCPRSSFNSSRTGQSESLEWPQR